MSEDKLYDKALDDLITYACSIVVEEMGNDIEEPETFEFSEEHKRKMRQLFRKERNRLRLKKLALFSKRVAACILAVAIVTSIPILSVEGWRVKFLNLIMDVNQTHTQISFNDDSTTGDTYHSDEISLDYIPKGFKLEKSDVRENYIYLKFKTGEQYFNFTMNNINSLVGIDTENAKVKRITINNQEAIYSSNRNINILVWHDDSYNYMLSGSIDEEEIIKIANNIKK